MNEKRKEVLAVTFTVQEVAKHLKVSEITIYRWLKKGEISGYKVGKLWRMDEKNSSPGLNLKKEEVKRLFLLMILS